MSFVFYDTETTGTETWFDQILQFAAILTDNDFNELDRFEIRCRLHPHVVPAPGAMKVTGVQASQLTHPSLPSHYEMMRAIRQKLLSWSPSIFMGWNTLSFDEELLRQAFYMTLHPPYLTNSDGNSRTDVIRMVQACSVICPNTLAFPLGAKGQHIFKLDQVAPANGFVHDKAHDALGDVEATIHMCKLVCERADGVWSSFMRFHNKASVVDYVGAEEIFCLTEFYYGKPYSWLVSAVGKSPTNNNEWYCFDVMVDPSSLAAMSDQQLRVVLSNSPKPVRKMKANGVPIICAADEAPGICKAKELGEEECLRRVQFLRDNPAFSKRLVSVMESMKQEYPLSTHVEKQIYNGFFNEDALLEKFHTVPWPERVALVDEFKDERLRRIGRHLIYLEQPHLVGEALRNEIAGYHASRLLGTCEEVSWVCLPKALKELDELLGASPDNQLPFLNEHKAFLNARHAEALKIIQ